MIELQRQNARKRTLPDIYGQQRYRSARSLLRALVIRTKKLCVLGYPKCAERRFRSYSANAQADRNLCSAYMSDLKNFSTGEVIFLKKDFDMWVHICFSFITSIFLKASKRLAWYVDSDETDVKQIPVKKKKKKKKKKKLYFRNTFAVWAL